MTASTTTLPVQPEAAQADLLGQAVPLKPPPVPLADGRQELQQGREDEETSDAPPAQDENQAGFIGQRHQPQR